MKNRLLVGLTLYFSLLTTIYADEAKEVKKEVENTIIQATKPLDLASHKTAKRYREVVISRNIYSKDKGAMKIKGRYLVFTSESLGILGKEDIFKIADGIGNIVVVYKGVPADDTDENGLLKLKEETKRYRNGVNLLVSPSLFKKYNVKKVPVIIKLDDDEMVEAYIKGTTDINKFIKLVDKNPLQTDFGVDGNLEQILEPELVEEVIID